MAVSHCFEFWNCNFSYRSLIWFVATWRHLHSGRPLNAICHAHTILSAVDDHIFSRLDATLACYGERQTGRHFCCATSDCTARLPAMWVMRRAVITSNPWDCEAQLAWKCLCTPTCRLAIWTRKVGHDDLVFDVLLGFGSGPVRARFEVSFYGG